VTGHQGLNNPDYFGAELGFGLYPILYNLTGVYYSGVRLTERVGDLLQCQPCEFSAEVNRGLISLSHRARESHVEVIYGYAIDVVGQKCQGHLAFAVTNRTVDCLFTLNCLNWYLCADTLKGHSYFRGQFIREMAIKKSLPHFG
jgi:hypothetical protein